VLHVVAGGDTADQPVAGDRSRGRASAAGARAALAPYWTL